MMLFQSREILRTKKIVNKRIIYWCTTRFSQLASQVKKCMMISKGRWYFELESARNCHSLEYTQGRAAFALGAKSLHVCENWGVWQLQCLKGHSQLWDSADLDTSSVSHFEKSSLHPEIKVHLEISALISQCFAWFSVVYWKTCFECPFAHPMILFLSYLIKVLLWSKNSPLFFFQILKACLFDTPLAKS